MSNVHRDVGRPVGPLRRRRGQPVLDKLQSTEHFSNKAKLTIADRRLILYLVVVLTDQYGCLTRTYEAILARYGQMPGHWAQGKDLAALQRAGSKFLGRAAMRRPSWDKIEDTVRAAIDQPLQTRLLAEAAGLYCHAARLARPDGYGGEIRVPAWAAADIVTVEMVRTELASMVPAMPRAPVDYTAVDEWPRTTPVVARAGRPAEQSEVQGTDAPAKAESDETIRELRETIRELREELARCRPLLDLMIRQYRIAVGEQEQHWADTAKVGQRLREVLAERDHLQRVIHRLYDQRAVLSADNLRLLRVLHPTASVQTLAKVAAETLAIPEITEQVSEKVTVAELITRTTFRRAPSG